MPPAGFEPAIPAGDQPQTLAWDRSATGIGSNSSFQTKLTVPGDLLRFTNLYLMSNKNKNVYWQAQKCEINSRYSNHRSSMTTLSARKDGCSFSATHTVVCIAPKTVSLLPWFTSRPNASMYKYKHVSRPYHRKQRSSTPPRTEAKLLKFASRTLRT